VDTEERQQIEGRLETRLAELARIRASRRADESDSELAHLDQHPADEGSDTHDREVDVTTEIFLEEEDRRITEARRALADGSYGICRDCGRDIPKERLEAMPEAIRCVDCQRRFEGRHRQITPA
jgi:phage/conjugal plasmid C-4 type zinc finger TraR family protein